MTACRVCRCTDDDCRQCIARTGSPCLWVEQNLCSACAPGVELRRHLEQLVQRGECSKREADEAFAFFDDLSDRELRGEVGIEEALRRVAEFGRQHLERRRVS